MGDFNIDWLDVDDNERTQYYTLPETFGLVQRIDMPTYENGHLLDYIITRESSNFASEFIVSDKISDHMALHASLTCQPTHPERKEIFVRSLKRINDDALMADLTGITIDSECRDVNSIVSHYDNTLSTIFDKHAPLKKICIVDRPMNYWINADIQALKAIRRYKEDIWRKNPIVINFQIYQESCLAVKNAINESKTKVIQKKIVDSKVDQKQRFKIVETLLGRTNK